MTPAQLAVERDRLLEGGRTPEQVERGQLAMADKPSVWLVQMHYDYEGEDVRAIHWTREAAIATATKLAKEYGDELNVIRDQPDDWRCVAGGGEMWVEPFVVSPSETATGAQPPRPEAPPAETCNCVPAHPRDCPPEGIHRSDCPAGKRQQARYASPREAP